MRIDADYPKVFQCSLPCSLRLHPHDGVTYDNAMNRFHGMFAGAEPPFGSTQLCVCWLLYGMNIPFSSTALVTLAEIFLKFDCQRQGKLNLKPCRPQTNNFSCKPFRRNNKDISSITETSWCWFCCVRYYHYPESSLRRREWNPGGNKNAFQREWFLLVSFWPRNITLLRAFYATEVFCHLLDAENCVFQQL